MFFTLEKFQRRVEELKERRYFNLHPVAPFSAMEGDLPEKRCSFFDKMPGWK